MSLSLSLAREDPSTEETRVCPFGPQRKPDRLARAGGHPRIRSAPPGTGLGVNFALFSAQCHQGRALPVRRCRRARSSSASSCRNTPTRSGTATCPTRGPAPSTATASTAPTSPTAGHRFNPNKLLLDPYAKQLVGQLQLEPGAVRLHDGERATTSPSTSATAPPSCRNAGSSTRPSPGAATGRPQTAVGAHDHLRDRMSRASRKLASRRAGASCAAPIAASRRPDVHPTTSSSSASRRSSCCRSTPSSTTATCSTRA